MKFLYIGQYSEGTTSKMRADALQALIKPEVYDVIDTHKPFYESHPYVRSLAFHFKKGPLINRLNNYILSKVNRDYDVIWVDKAVFIKPNVTKLLGKKSNILIHYTPDTAFEENRSKYFYKSIPYYNYLITTKSFEEEYYLQDVNKDRLLFVPQGFDKTLHYPRHKFFEKENKVVFIGLNEPSREEAISELLKNNIRVDLAGENWMKFVNRNQHPNLEFLGESLFKDDYAHAISSSLFGLGLVSKRFPELHTTRTFEIPACGTALLTERNSETLKGFKDDEAIFFSSHEEMVNKILFFAQDKEALRLLSQKGYDSVLRNGYDYQSQLLKICEITGILPKV